MEALANQPSLPAAARPINDGSWVSPGYRDATTRARWAQLFFGLVAFGAILEVALLAQGLNLVDSIRAGDVVSDATLAAYFKNSSDADHFYLAAVVGLAVTFLAWLSRTVENTPPLGGGTPHDSPRWAIGWWFVPIAFLWKPFTVVRDAWQRLATADHASGVALVGAWWGTYLGAMVLGRYVNAATASADSDAINELFLIAIVGDILAIIGAVSGFLVVREIQARSDARARSLGLAVASSRPAGVPTSVSIETSDTTPLPSVHFCPSCGARWETVGHFCASCGANIGALAATGE